MQRNHPIAYISQELKDPEKHLSAYEREMLGIILATSGDNIYRAENSSLKWITSHLNTCWSRDCTQRLNMPGF